MLHLVEQLGWRKAIPVSEDVKAFSAHFAVSPFG